DGYRTVQAAGQRQDIGRGVRVEGLEPVVHEIGKEELAAPFFGKHGSGMNQRRNRVQRVERRATYTAANHRWISIQRRFETNVRRISLEAGPAVVCAGDEFVDLLERAIADVGETDASRLALDGQPEAVAHAQRPDGAVFARCFREER